LVLDELKNTRNSAVKKLADNDDRMCRNRSRFQDKRKRTARWLRITETASPVHDSGDDKSSKVCLFCFKELRLVTSLRLVKGKIKTIRLNGAVECWNPACPFVKAGYTML
ncbi:hypothetical protein BGZ65_010569, partial [Modicella reniformis]